MARWRDVKKGNLKKNTNNKEIQNNDINLSLCNASLMARFKAFITDTFMLTMPLMYIVFYFVMGSREDFAANKLMGWIYIFAPHFIIIFSLWFFKQQTPGLKAYELSIVDSYSGEKPTWVSLINRYIQTSLGIFLILPLLFPFFNKEKRTFQDIMSGTCIKNTPNPIKKELKQDNKK